jgi:hypothetical protein
MPLWLLALIYFFFLSLVLSVWAALGNVAAFITLATMTTLLLLIWIKSRLIIEITADKLKVGRAHIDLKYIDHAIELNSNEMRNIRGRDANPRAYLGIRFWSSTGVKITLNDKRDETPYWLITSNKTNQLVNALKVN